MAIQNVPLATPPTQVRPQAAPAQLQREELLLHRYRVVESCGNGGFASVEVCWDTRLRRRVAIKRIPLSTDVNQTAWQTINEALNESRTAALLAHPNIVTVFDFEYDDTFAYIVMEYVDGLTLSEMLARVEGGCLTPDEAAHVIDSLANALAYAHENGVLHLDIKPANVMFDRSGTVKLGDFGMATLASAAGFGGARGGTVGYMSPEQLSGEYVDERADIFSFAVVCYEMLTGTQPFAAPTAEKSLKLIERGCDPLSDRCPEAGLIASDAMSAALSPGPVARPQSVGDFTDAMLSSLGNATAGKDSIHSLMLQVEEEDEAEAIAWKEARKTPSTVSLPWLIPTLERLASALCMGFISWKLSEPIGLTQNYAMLLAACVGGGSLLSPQVGTLLALAVAVVATGCSGVTSMAFPTACGLAIFSFIWWYSCGRTNRLAGVAFLMPALTGASSAGAAIAGYGCNPICALLTGIAAPIFGSFVQSLVISQFNAAAALSNFAASMQQPTLWIVSLGCGAAAWLIALFSSPENRARSATMQLIGGGIVVAALFFAKHLENGGSWPIPRFDELLFAVSFSILMAIISGLLGPDSTGRSDEQ